MSWIQTKSWVKLAVQGKQAIKLIHGCMGNYILLLRPSTVYNKIQVLTVGSGQIHVKIGDVSPCRQLDVGPAMLLQTCRREGAFKAGSCASMPVKLGFSQG